MPELPDSMEERKLELKEKGRPEMERWRTLRDAIVGLPEPVNGFDADDFANHRWIPSARAYPKHSGSPSTRLPRPSRPESTKSVVARR